MGAEVVRESRGEGPCFFCGEIVRGGKRRGVNR